jgi:hypothetical protein
MLINLSASEKATISTTKCNTTFIPANRGKAIAYTIRYTSFKEKKKTHRGPKKI